MKLLLIIIVIGAVYFLFIKKKPSIKDKQNNSKKQTPKANDMIECTNCGMYCEVDDMTLSDAKYYCSNECIRGEA
jgi:uncharacterized protein